MPEEQSDKSYCIEIRRDVIDMAAHSAHVAPALSCVEMLVALYRNIMHFNPAQPESDDRDRLIFSKGHGCMALYAVLARNGFFSRDLLREYCQDDSILAEHPLAGAVPGAEIASGALGHGLAVAAGTAHALRLRAVPRQTYALLGDGECDEGAVWEAAAMASSHGLDTLCALVDYNGFQACNRCSEVSPRVDMSAQWTAFGWEVVHVDGHDISEMTDVIKRPRQPGQPRVLLCHTDKGHGIDFMENNLEWHYRPVRGEERVQALKVLDNA